jgi:hypothetical protein
VNFNAYYAAPSFSRRRHSREACPRAGGGAGVHMVALEWMPAYAGITTLPTLLVSNVMPTEEASSLPRFRSPDPSYVRVTDEGPKYSMQHVIGILYMEEA